MGDFDVNCFDSMAMGCAAKEMSIFFMHDKDNIYHHKIHRTRLCIICLLYRWGRSFVNLVGGAVQNGVFACGCGMARF